MSDILSWPLAWLEGTPFPGAPLATRVSLRRNLRNLPFPARADGGALQDLVIEVLELCGDIPLVPDFLSFPLEHLGPLQKDLLRECRLLDPTGISDRPETALVTEESGTLSLTVNGEDHLRFQALYPGLAIDEAFDAAARLERGMERLGYAFDETLGYLTARGGDLGTGLRCAVSVHLPALTLTHRLTGAVEPLTKRGMALLPLGDDQGALYDVSHRISLGPTEGELLEQVRSFVDALRDEESRTRDALLARQRLPIEDLCWRSFGVLRYARQLPLDEALRFLSVVRLGSELELLPALEISRVACERGFWHGARSERLSGDGAWKRLVLGILPGHVRARNGDGEDGAREAEARAHFLRESLADGS